MKPKVIIIYSPGQPFIVKCVCAIIQEAGYSMAVVESGIVPEGPFDFIIIESKEYNYQDDLDCDLIFTNFAGEASIDLIKWMRSKKHGNCMDINEHPQGLNNYNNFKNFVMPLNFLFKKDGYDFTKCNPSNLVERLR